MPVNRWARDSDGARMTSIIPLCVLAWVALVPLHGSGAAVFALLRSTMLAVTAGLTGLVAARRTTDRTRAGWVLLAIACLSWGLGNAYWSRNELLAHADPLFPTFADFGFVVFPMAGGLLVLALPAPAAR